MLITDHLRKSGNVLFRRRSYVLLIFLPFMALSLRNGEVIEATTGDLIGDAFEVACLLLVALGQGIRIATVGFVPAGTSGRNTHGQLAKSLNTTGLYSLVRNPLYVGNCLMYLGIVAYTQHLVLTLIMALVLALYYERIIAAEEDFLTDKFGDAYSDWAARVPAFFPRTLRWTPPSMPFSMRTVIRREHASIFGAIVMLFLIELGLHLFSGEGEPLDLGWKLVMAAAIAAEIAALWAKKRTRLLSVEGR